jgi:hypothetical protein
VSVIKPYDIKSEMQRDSFDSAHDTFQLASDVEKHAAISNG